MNKIKEKSVIEIIENLQKCDYVFNDEIAHHCLRLSIDDIKIILDVAYCHLEFVSKNVLEDELVSFNLKNIQENIKNTLGTINDLKDIKKIVMNKENACKCDFYEEYEEDENGEMIYRCLDCDSTFYKYDD